VIAEGRDVVAGLRSKLGPATTRRNERPLGQTTASSANASSVNPTMSRRMIGPIILAA